MRPHENLNVWKRAVEYVLRIYTLTRAFPHDVVYALTSQMRRAAVSVAANIAEGAGRRSPKRICALPIKRSGIIRANLQRNF